MDNYREETVLRENKRKSLRYAFAILGLVSAAALVGVIWCYASFLFAVLTPDSTAVGIIGGADGPTAIFVTEAPIPNAATIFCPILGLIIAIIGIHKTKKHK